MKKIIDKQWETFKSFEPEWYEDEEIMKAFFEKCNEEAEEHK